MRKFHFLEIEALQHGGYVIREASAANSGLFHPELAAFTSLDHALQWIAEHLAPLPETVRT